ncbi:MAG: Uma2 family endonuclease [Phycisphaerae bacterium]
MIVRVTPFLERSACYRGLRMTARQYLQLEEDEVRYELVDGVVCMSPSPNCAHQQIGAQISCQIGIYLDANPLGHVMHEIDVNLDDDLVYRPDVVFVAKGRVSPDANYITGPPDLVVEIISESSRRYDRETKKDDYERCGVGEYWLIDPGLHAMTFYRLVDGKYVEVAPEGNQFASQALPGFRLDLTKIKKGFPPPGK